MQDNQNTLHITLNPINAYQNKIIFLDKFPIRVNRDCKDFFITVSKGQYGDQGYTYQRKARSNKGKDVLYQLHQRTPISKQNILKELRDATQDYQIINRHNNGYYLSILKQGNKHIASGVYEDSFELTLFEGNYDDCYINSCTEVPISRGGQVIVSLLFYVEEFIMLDVNHDSFEISQWRQGENIYLTMNMMGNGLQDNKLIVYNEHYAKYNSRNHSPTIGRAFPIHSKAQSLVSSKPPHIQLKTIDLKQALFGITALSAHIKLHSVYYKANDNYQNITFFDVIDL